MLNFKIITHSNALQYEFSKFLVLLEIITANKYVKTDMQLALYPF